MTDTKGMKTDVDIEILSVKDKQGLSGIVNRSDEVRERLQNYGFSVTYINDIALNAKKIKASLNQSATTPEKPEIVIIANALTTQGTKSFRKQFAEVVAAAEHAENTPAPKNYWKQRNLAFRKAKKSGASQEELDSLTEEFRMFKKKSKVFNLGQFGNGYKGYCFMYKGIKVAVLPKSELTGVDICDMLSLAAVRTNEVFENSAVDYPEGFSSREYVPAKTGFANRFIPLRGDGGKEATRKCLVIASFLVFLTALSFLMYNMVFLSVKNSELNGEIQKIAHGTEVGTGKDNNKPAVDDKIDWDKLLDINKEIVGWIQIDNSNIDYPVLWHKSDDRSTQYYLSHNYQGDYDAYGSIFLDYRCTKGTDSKNTVIHGHHMNDGSMFADLLKYGGTSGNLDYYKKSPTIEFDTPDGDGTYKIISVFKTNTLSMHGEFFNYMIGNFQNDKDFMNYVYNVRMRSLFNCPVDVNEDDELITLSTCSYEFDQFRTVVVARKVRKGESAKIDVSQASVNSNAVWPQVYYSSRGGTRPTLTDFCTAYEAGQIDWYNGDYDFKEQKVVEATTAPTQSSNNSQNQQTPQATAAPPTTQAKVYLTVKFINYDGTEISSQQVEYGKAAVAPANPTKPSDDYYDYVFKEWQLDFSKVTRDMSIAPKFEPVLKQQNSQAQEGQ